MASMQIGLTKKLQAHQVIEYKRRWEELCSNDITALSRQRFTFYYCIYKNPQRLLEAYYSLNAQERKSAVDRIRSLLVDEEDPKEKDALFGMNAVPRTDQYTRLALASVSIGEPRPSYLGTFKPHPGDPSYSTDCSTQQAMAAYHMYDLWCQVVGQTIAVARGTVPLEDLYEFKSADAIDQSAGRLVTFRLTVRGKGIHIPRMWKEYPVGSISSRVTLQKQVFRVQMQLRTMYLFSDTSAVNLRVGRVSGLGLLNGAVKNEKNEIELQVVPLLIGTGGWNLYPEHFTR